MSFKSIIVSTRRWRLVSGRFHLRPGVHIDPLHLRPGACQSATNQFRLRHCRAR
jgi:hypothetical protein